MKGTGADNKTYNGVPQFHSFQVGLGIPIFVSAQKARINAAKLNESIAANEYETGFKTFEKSYKAALVQYQKYSEAVKYFENIALKNADLITSTATKQFMNGDINYLDWVLLIHQATNIRSDYIEARKSRNASVIEINSFINK